KRVLFPISLTGMLKCATDLSATIVVLPDCIDRNLVIASETKQSRAAGQRGCRARDCFVAPPLAMTAQPGRAPHLSAKRSRSPRSGRDPVLNRNNFYEPGMRVIRISGSFWTRVCFDLGR